MFVHMDANAGEQKRQLPLASSRKNRKGRRGSRGRRGQQCPLRHEFLQMTNALAGLVVLVS